MPMTLQGLPQLPGSSSFARRGSWPKVGLCIPTSPPGKRECYFGPVGFEAEKGVAMLKGQAFIPIGGLSFPIVGGLHIFPFTCIHHFAEWSWNIPQRKFAGSGLRQVPFILPKQKIVPTPHRYAQGLPLLCPQKEGSRKLPSLEKWVIYVWLLSSIVMTKFIFSKLKPSFFGFWVYLQRSFPLRTGCMPSSISDTGKAGGTSGPLGNPGALSQELRCSLSVYISGWVSFWQSSCTHMEWWTPLFTETSP